MSARFMLLLIFFATVSARARAEEFVWSPVRVSDFGSTIKVTGRIVPQTGALSMESASIQGRITGILAKEGDWVRTGSALFSISSVECHTLAEERRVARQKNIPELIAGVDKREHQLGLLVAENRCDIVSTHAGVMTKRLVEAGAAFNSGDVLATLLDTAKLTVEFDLAERESARVRAGQKISFHLASEPEKEYHTAVEAVVPIVDPTSRTVRVRIARPKLSGPARLDGLVYGQVETGSKEIVYKVPSPAVIFNQNARYVVKGPENAPVAVAVDVLSEAGGTSLVRPVKALELAENDVVATKYTIFLFKKTGVGSQP